MTVLILQHVPWEKPAALGNYLTDAGVPWRLDNLTAAVDVVDAPRISELSGLVLLGGPMGAHDTDRYPGLALEADLVRRAADAGLPILGICLGHQIVASALGADLHPGTAAEVGVGEVEVVADGIFGRAGDRQPVLHWHFDVVDAPPGAVVQASTPQTPNQAFTLGDSIFGTQFHIEVTPDSLADWLAEPAMIADLPPGLAITLLDDLAAASDAIKPSANRLFEAFASGLQK
ncbi:gamma-glutamyl-gamma-aminobutyrate hydrolase family protein [Kribbella sp. NPDC056861]|uniref:type 1 glutamine amidotransferase n=1 Tax=Kribbella sp. NPDC056861 TaxID=3154857 RepID=UPI0034220F6E